MTLTEQLTQINAAITAIETGAQEYRTGTKFFKRADLATLYEERRNLERRIAEEVNDSFLGNSYVAKFTSR